MRLLLVDDSKELLELVGRALSREGHEVVTAETLATAQLALTEETPDVLILDLALPDGTGVDWCKSLRAQGNNLPILLLTAHGEVQQRVSALDAGADDFLAKPFAIAELRARVRALARRGPLIKEARIFAGDTELDLATRRAYRQKEEVPITGREWAILEMLISRSGRVVDRQALLMNIWDDVSDKASASLDVIVGRLRRKLGENVIRTVRGQGYTFDA